MKELKNCYIGVKNEEVIFIAKDAKELSEKVDSNNGVEVFWINKYGTAQEVDIEEEIMLYVEGRN